MVSRMAGSVYRGEDEPYNRLHNKLKAGEACTREELYGEDSGMYTYGFSAAWLGERTEEHDKFDRDSAPLGTTTK